MNSERGMTIIETTVILSVLFILAGAMSPIVSESVTTARTVKAKNDAAMIAMGLINLQKDLGADALTFGDATTVSAQAGLPEVLASDGSEPNAEESAEGDVEDSGVVPRGFRALFNGEGIGAEVAERVVLREARRRWRQARSEPLEDHLYTNRRGYRYRRPGESGGWNGPYVSAHLKGDPWGNQYLINSQWFDGGSTVADSQGRPRRAVFVVSAGANGVVDTPYEQTIVDARAFGDDLVVRIQ
jgi:type II secretory pathway pseudopilin PulG